MHQNLESLCRFLKGSQQPQLVLRKLNRAIKRRDRNRAKESFLFYENLPQHIKQQLFSYLDLQNLSTCASVCKEWKEWIIEVYPIHWIRITFNLFKTLCRKFQTISDSLNSLISKLEASISHRIEVGEFVEANKIDTSAEKGRIKYLQETITDFQKILEQSKFLNNIQDTQQYLKQEPNKKMIQGFIKISDLFKEILFDAMSYYTSIFLGQREMNVNFDMIELTIRRNFLQLSKMFLEPYQKNGPVLYNPELVIEDPQSRLAWKDLFGPGAYFVPIEDFKRKYLSQLSEEVRLAIEVTVHFPANNYVTPYAFHLLACYWGPFEAISKNMSTYALSSGFMGLLNTFSADEKIKQCKEPVYLIRYSRADPELLTFSSTPSKSPVCSHLCFKSSSLLVLCLFVISCPCMARGGLRQQPGIVA
eukprot:TRINITY_DN2739_c0_g2_i2.p1 TRINITY_DN2739_c0_g2~~TRINITY_DN2739_c0_g2_i2.p1  ORF type:complete len:419 (-),score=77.39 TRINITY_DN2739_c0_g2_i2:217-1473(-)